MQPAIVAGGQIATTAASKPDDKIVAKADPAKDQTGSTLSPALDAEMDPQALCCLGQLLVSICDAISGFIAWLCGSTSVQEDLAPSQTESAEPRVKKALPPPAPIAPNRSDAPLLASRPESRPRPRPGAAPAKVVAAPAKAPMAVNRLHPMRHEVDFLLGWSRRHLTYPCRIAVVIKLHHPALDPEAVYRDKLMMAFPERNDAAYVKAMAEFLEDFRKFLEERNITIDDPHPTKHIREHDTRVEIGFMAISPSKENAENFDYDIREMSVSCVGPLNRSAAYQQRNVAVDKHDVENTFFPKSYFLSMRDYFSFAEIFDHNGALRLPTAGA